jgi:hypothetical protein
MPENVNIDIIRFRVVVEANLWLFHNAGFVLGDRA